MIHSRWQHVDQESILLGIQHPDAKPLMVPRAMCDEHIYIAGQTGSGKTALGFIPLLVQLARPWKSARRRPNGALWPDEQGRTLFKDEPRPPIIIIDVKGDPALFNSARIQARDQGYEFKHFSLDDQARRPGYIFDIFQNLQPCPPKYFAELILLALGILHGEGYGKSHFTRANLARFTEALLTADGRPQTVRSWEHLMEVVGDPSVLARLPSAADADELVNAVHGMKFIEKTYAQGRAPDNIGVIHMPTVLRQRQMIYFWLPARIAPMAVREIGKLALYAINHAAKELADEGQKTQCYVFMDEFHLLAGRNLEQILTQSRSAGISLIMANQYSSRLTEEELDLRQMVYENTRIKQYFTLSDPYDIDQMTKASGQTTRWLRSKGRAEHVQYDLLGQVFSFTGETETGYTTSTSEKEVVCPRFDTDLPRQASDDPIGSIVWIQRGDGMAQFGGVPIWVQSLWPMEAAEYRRRNGFKIIPWPTPKDDPPAQPAPPVPTQAPPRSKEQVKKHSELFEKLLNEETERSGGSSALLTPSPAPKKKSKPSKNAKPPGGDTTPAP